MKLGLAWRGCCHVRARDVGFGCLCNLYCGQCVCGRCEASFQLYFFHLSSLPPWYPQVRRVFCDIVIRAYNGFAVLNDQHFEVAKNFPEIDPTRGVGWVLIVKGVILICDIGRDKSELRNMKNQNFEISECWSDVSECWNR